MLAGLVFSFAGVLWGWATDMSAQEPKQIVQQAVNTELAAGRDDHSRWIYLEVDRKPKSEDDVKTKFKRLPDGVTLQEAEKELMQQNE